MSNVIESTSKSKYCTLRFSEDNGMILEVKIEAIVHRVILTGHMSFQHNGRYSLRGILSVLSPKTMTVLTIVESVHAEDNTVSQQEKRASREIRFQAASALTAKEMKNTQTQIAEYLDGCVQSLVQKYFQQIVKMQKEISTPHTLTPFYAWVQYGKKFISLKHRNMGKKKSNSLQKQMYKMLFDADDKPMVDFSTRDIQRYLSKTKHSTEQATLLYHFWEYCIDSGYCHCERNPVPQPEKKRLTPEALQKKATTPSILSVKQIQHLAEILLNNASGADCGIALMLSGFSLETVIELKWSDIIFEDGSPWVHVKYFRNDLAGSVHNYTRPVILETCKVLRKRHDILISQYNESKVAEMPVVSQIKNPQNHLPKADFKQYKQRRLADIGIIALGPSPNGKKVDIPENILIDTYKYRVGNCMGIGDDDGTKAFLRGEKLTSVSDQHYISYTSKDAQARLDAVLNRAAPAEIIETTVERVENADGSFDYYFHPKRTDCVVNIALKAIIPKGAETIDISSEHGVTVCDSVREALPDGKKRRKTSKK